MRWRFLPHISAFVVAVTASAQAGAQTDDSSSAQAQMGERRSGAGQVDPTTPAAGAPPETGGPETEIVVTGSRVPRPEADFPNPITSFTSTTIQQSGETNLTEFLAETPALVGSSTSSDRAGSNVGFGASFGTVGLNLLNLRNLGENRTLVLVNGRRHVGAVPGSAAVDINSIPLDLIERVDVLTGGASAVYGADAVSGVVNFILRRDFEGMRVRAQSGISQRGDAGNRFASVVIGTNLADGRGNIAGSYEFNDASRLSTLSRPTGDPARNFQFVRNPDDFPDDPQVPDRIALNDLRYADSSRGGAVDVDFDGISDFVGTGEPYDRGRLLPESGGLTQGGSSTPIAGYAGDLLPKNRRHVVNLLSSFELGRALRLFAEAKFVDTRAFTFGQPTFDFFTFIAPDNPFIPQNIRAVALDGLQLTRDNFDLGVRSEAADRQTMRGVLGIDGRLSDAIGYEIAYIYGRTETQVQSNNNRLADRYFAALDAVTDPATGRPTCRSNLFPNEPITSFGSSPVTFVPGPNSGCSPLNLFGEFQRSEAARQFVTVDAVSSSRLSQHVVSGFISSTSGDFFELPGGAIGFALGAEYRRESSSSRPDENFVAGNILDNPPLTPQSGKFEVREVFAELNLPLLRDAPFAERLSVGGAARLSDYSTVGTTTTWRVDGIYAPIRDVSFRATYSQAVRAPNIGELFAPQGGTEEFINDPCDPVNIPQGTQFRQANCAAVLIALGIEPAGFSPTSDPRATVTLPGLVSGNPDLSEETAKTLTAGMVLRPRFLHGFTASVDWYDIRIRNAVSTASAQDIVNLCVDQSTLDNRFCAAVTRDLSTGFVSNFVVRPENVASFRTSGADLTLNYLLNPRARLGSFNFRLIAGYLHRLAFIPTPGGELDEDRGETNAPRYVSTADLTWTRGPLTLNYGVSWFSKARRFSREEQAADPDIADSGQLFYKEKWEHDVQVSYDVADRATLYAGVNNLLDEKPAIPDFFNFPPSPVPVGPVGRYFYVGARVGMDRLF